MQSTIKARPKRANRHIVKVVKRYGINSVRNNSVRNSMLAYYLQWHLVDRLRPLFESDGTGKERCWTVAGVIDCLAQIRSNRVSANEVQFDQITEISENQRTILDLLKIAM